MRAQEGPPIYLIAARLGGMAVTVEHAGGTAVPGLAAKPIIDMDVLPAASEFLPISADGYRSPG
jgi:GrpB-like predicted nucleotidyltransferase (UPF0157 family)